MILHMLLIQIIKKGGESLKKKPFILIIIFCFLIVLFGCNDGNNDNNVEEEARMKEKLLYSVEMCFYSSVGNFWVKEYDTGNYVDFVFVSSEDKTHDYSKEVIVAWPGDNTKKILYNLNDYVSDEDIDLSPFSLTGPIAMDDVVEKWEDVKSLLDSFSVSVRAYILDPGNAPSDFNEKLD